ncbi:MAG: alpha/beta hydrolase-fold protein [Phycisphaerales bacterium]|nr:alpha/beta hydrolase-fold protein [Phycisphaerales bacterium]
MIQIVVRTIFLCVPVFLLNVCTFSQYTLKIVVNSIHTPIQAPVFVAGNFNNWAVKDDAFEMHPFGGGRKVLTLKNMTPGNYEFTFSRGAHTNRETTIEGATIEPHEVVLHDDTTVYYTIDGWLDCFDRPYTAVAQVTLLDSAFYAPELNNKRKIWVYVPSNYNESETRYPVLYMPEGQNLFNERTAVHHEWGIDKFLDSIERKTNQGIIVVGIEAFPNLVNREEDNFNQNFPYLNFVVHTLKGHIDSTLRTLTDRQHTFIAGSDRSSVVALMGLEEYPEIFSVAGLFSPDFTKVSNNLLQHIANNNFKNEQYVFIATGARESNTALLAQNQVIEALQKKHTNLNIRKVEFPNGMHGEHSWGKQFPSFYEWLMQIMHK